RQFDLLDSAFKVLVQRLAQFVQLDSEPLPNRLRTRLISGTRNENPAWLARKILKNAGELEKLSLINGIAPVLALHDGPVADPACFELPVDVDLVRRESTLQIDIVLHVYGVRVALIEDLVEDSLRQLLVRLAGIRHRIPWYTRAVSRQGTTPFGHQRSAR